MPTILLLMGSVLCVAFYLYAYFAAENPHKGTLEWISMQEKPALTRQGILHRLKWLDILWSFLMGLMAQMLCLGLAACVDVAMMRTSLASGHLFLATLPMVLSAIAAYLLGKLLSGRFVGGMLPALFLCLHLPISISPAEALLLLVCVLTLLGHFTGKGFFAWLCLVLSGIMLGLSTWGQPLYIFFALPWLGTVLLGEILRTKQEDMSPWHLILTLLAAVLSLGITIAIVHFPLYAADLSAALKTPGCYAMFWLQLVITIPAKFFAAPDFYLPLLLPSATLLLAGVAMAVGAAKRHHALGIVMLLWTVFGLLLAVFFPSAHPTFLSVWVLAWLVSRIDKRGYRGAALVTGLVPAVLSLFMTFLTMWR